MGTLEDFTNMFTLPDYPSRVFRMKDDDWIRLEDRGEHIFLPKNCTLVEPGDEVRYCYQVVSGQVLSLEQTPEGSVRIFNIFDEGSIFLESNLLCDAPAAVFFQTQMPTELVRIGRDTLYQMIEEDPAIALYLLKSMSYKYYSAMDQVREKYSHNSTWRVYNLFVLLTANFGVPRDDEWVMINLKISQQMVGDLLGMNRTTVTGVIKELKQKELIQNVNGYYCIRSGSYL